MQRSRLWVRAQASRVMEFGRRAPAADFAGSAAAPAPLRSCILKFSPDRWFTNVCRRGHEKFIYYLV